MNVYDFYITPEEYEKAKAHGVSPTLLEQRVRFLAWEKEKAVVTPPIPKKSLKEWIALAEENGICYSTLRYRINRLGWEPERAATQSLQDRKKQAFMARESGRKYPKEIVALLEKNDIPYDCFRYRVRHGWDMYEAATKPRMTPSEVGLMTKHKRSCKKLFLKR